MTRIGAVRVLDPHPWNTLVEIEADDGTVGIGLTQSASVHIRPLIEDGPGALRTHLIGRDPLDVAGLWRAMFEGWPGQYGRGSEGGLAANAMGALDIALWDLAGKLQGKPVWELLGGKVQDRVMAYASGSMFVSSSYEGGGPGPWEQKSPERLRDEAAAEVAKGFRALKFSANTALDELMPEKTENKKLEISGWMAAVNIVFSLGFFIFMYKFLPLVAATELKRVNPIFAEQIVFNLVDGVIRIGLFLLFIWGVSLFKDIRRVYEYHGAEHKTVYAFENGDPLEIPAVQKYTTYHPRCGTSFLMTVMIISILVYTLVPVTTFWARFGIRIALLPVIAGVSYEIIRFAAKHRGSRVFAVPQLFCCHYFLSFWM